MSYRIAKVAGHALSERHPVLAPLPLAMRIVARRRPAGAGAGAAPGTN